MVLSCSLPSQKSDAEVELFGLLIVELAILFFCSFEVSMYFFADSQAFLLFRIIFTFSYSHSLLPSHTEVQSNLPSYIKISFISVTLLNAFISSKNLSSF